MFKSYRQTVWTNWLNSRITENNHKSNYPSLLLQLFMFCSARSHWPSLQEERNTAWLWIYHHNMCLMNSLLSVFLQTLFAAGVQLTFVCSSCCPPSRAIWRWTLRDQHCSPKTSASRTAWKTHQNVHVSSSADAVQENVGMTTAVDRAPEIYLLGHYTQFNISSYHCRLFECESN